MRLGGYTVRFPAFPWLPSVCPFGGWGSTGNPTQDLPWYDAYPSDFHSNLAKRPTNNSFPFSPQVSRSCIAMIQLQQGTALQ